MFARSIISMMLVVAGTAVCVGGVYADSKGREQDMVRQAVERGEIKPLADILATVRNKLPGEVVKVEIEQKRDRWFYELRVLDARGRLFEVYIDAQTGVIDRVKEK
jgi:uncharacterized membrane protein YkoI